MKQEVRTKTVKYNYNVYIAKDGKEFNTEDECIHHEMMLDGIRIVCPNCNGQGSWKTDYVPEYDHWDGTMGGYWNYEKCPKCKGKGYLEKKVTWE